MREGEEEEALFSSAGSWSAAMCDGTALKKHHKGRELQVTVLKRNVTLINDAVSGTKLVKKEKKNRLQYTHNIRCSGTLEIRRILEV